jgi:hypothetical protein
MNWEQYKIGTEVLCAYCGGHRIIEAAGVYNGGAGFELSCGHRSAFCENCKILVPDKSNETSTVIPECPDCTFST